MLHPGLKKNKNSKGNRFSGGPLLMEKFEPSGEENNNTKTAYTFNVEGKHVVYAKGVIGALVSVFGILVIFSVFFRACNYKNSRSDVLNVYFYGKIMIFRKHLLFLLDFLSRFAPH